jgi:hypothetical protein
MLLTLFLFVLHPVRHNTSCLLNNCTQIKYSMSFCVQLRGPCLISVDIVVELYIFVNSIYYIFIFKVISNKE